MIRATLRAGLVIALLNAFVKFAAPAQAVVVFEDTFQYADNAALVAGGWKTGALGVPSVATTYFFTGSGSNWISTDPAMQPPVQSGQSLMRLGNAIAFRELGVTLTEDFTLTAKVAIAGYSRSMQIGLGNADGAGYSLQWNAALPTQHAGNGFLQLFAQNAWTQLTPNEANSPGTAGISTPVSTKTPPTAYPLPASVVQPLPYTPNDTFLGFTEIKLTWSAADGQLQAFQNNELIPDDATLIATATDPDFYTSFTRVYIGGGTNSFIDSVTLETNQAIELPGQDGDFDDDDDVDGLDFLKWQEGNSPNLGSPEDLAKWRTHYGVTPTVANLTAAPEPGAWALAATASMVLARRRRAKACSA